MPFVEASFFASGTGSVKIFRLFRLARLAKLVHKVPKLRMIVVGLVGGFKSIGYIMILLLLVFYMFGVAGMSLFSDNDPFHFNTVPRAILTLFRAATLEDWTDIMYARFSWLSISASPVISAARVWVDLGKSLILFS